MATRRMRKFLDRWVTKGAQKMLLGMAVFGLLVFVCWLPWYILVGPQEPYPDVDTAKLNERVRREQPVGGTADETIAFLRSLDIEDRHIRIRLYAASSPGASRVTHIEGWYPQPRAFFWGYERIVVSCDFTNSQRVEWCSTYPAAAYTPFDHGQLYDVTPVPAQ
jgi:hypothetical protein